MRDEGLYLQDILDAADDLAEFLAGVSKEQFVGSDLLTSAVLHKLLIIGEAAAHVSKETRARYPEVDWADIVAFRNFAIHAYFSVDIERVWNAAVLDAPLLRERIAQIVAEHYPNEEEE